MVIGNLKENIPPPLKIPRKESQTPRAKSDPFLDALLASSKPNAELEAEKIKLANRELDIKERQLAQAEANQKSMMEIVMQVYIF